MIQNLLYELKKKFIKMIKEQLNIKQILENKVMKEKKDINELLFKNICLKRTKNLFNIENTIVSEIGENDYDSELFHLKLLNFIAENEIKSTEFQLNKKIKLLIYLKSMDIFEEEIREKNYGNKEELNEILEILHKKVIIVRNKFRRLVHIKRIQDSEIQCIEEKISCLKNSNNYYFSKYILSKDIIEEESRNGSFPNTLNSINNIKISNGNEISNKVNVNMNIGFNINISNAIYSSQLIKKFNNDDEHKKRDENENEYFKHDIQKYIEMDGAKQK